jgi:hypothetical protein
MSSLLPVFLVFESCRIYASQFTVVTTPLQILDLAVSPNGKYMLSACGSGLTKARVTQFASSSLHSIDDIVHYVRHCAVVGMVAANDGISHAVHAYEECRHQVPLRRILERFVSQFAHISI